MRVVIQRVKEASVTVESKLVSKIGPGLLIFLGITHSDSSADAVYLARRCSALRIFEDAEGKMNLSVKETAREVLIVSQFTLYADTRKGNRPSFVEAAPGTIAEPLYELFVHEMQEECGREFVKTGVFGAMMDVGLINDGPVTVGVESKG